MWYAVTSVRGADGKQKKFKMHNLILGIKYVDHIDGNGLNNGRGNLRPCTNSQNQQNTRARGGASGFEGVSWIKSKGRWKVAFNHDRKTHFVGYFDNEIEAARAYNAAILPLAGEFARLNLGD